MTVLIRTVSFYILEQFENRGFRKLKCDCTFVPSYPVLIYVVYTVRDTRVAFVSGKAALLRNVSCYVRQSTEQICASALHCFLPAPADQGCQTSSHNVTCSRTVPPSDCNILYAFRATDLFPVRKDLAVVTKSIQK